MLRFYANLATYQSSLAIPAPAAGSDTLDFADAVDVEAAAAAVPGLLDWLRRHGPAPLAQNTLAIDHVVHSHWRDAMRQRLVADDLDTPDGEALTGFVAEALLQPFAEAAAVPRREGLRRIAGARARCPVCGSRPSVAALREEGHGSKRTLVCGLCLTEWDYLRLVCPGCGEERFEALPVYTAEALPHARVDACDSCHAYVKTVDLTRDGTAVPLVDDLASLPLDLWARERGYHRLRPGLLRV
jgi:FdhE protein